MRIFFERSGIREHGGDESTNPEMGETREWRGEQYECVRNDGAEASFQKSAVIAARAREAKATAPSPQPVVQGDVISTAAAVARGSEPAAPGQITAATVGLSGATTGAANTGAVTYAQDAAPAPTSVDVKAGKRK